MKNQKGITLMGLVITIILIIILASIGLGASVNMVDNVDRSQDAEALADLAKIQQAIFEVYTKYMQTKNESVLIGTKMSYNEAKAVEQEFKNLENGENISLKQNTYNLDNAKPEECYYRLDKEQLIELGMNQVKDNAEYIVNYSTGEVFENYYKKTETGTILYVSK